MTDVLTALASFSGSDETSQKAIQMTGVANAHVETWAMK